MSRTLHAGPSKGIGAKVAAFVKAPLRWSWKGRIGAIVVLLGAMAGAAYATGHLKVPKDVKLPFGLMASEAGDASDEADDEASDADETAESPKLSKRERARAKRRAARRSKEARKKRRKQRQRRRSDD